MKTTQIITISQTFEYSKQLTIYNIYHIFNKITYNEYKIYIIDNFI